MNESSKLVRPIYVKIKLIDSRDWTNWSNTVHKYMAALEIQDILKEVYEMPEQNTPEHALYKAQEILLRSFILETAEQYQHLYDEQTDAREQYKILKEHLDLGQHTHRYYAAKECLTASFTTLQVAIEKVNVFAKRMKLEGISTIQELLPYLLMVMISPGYHSAINQLLTDKLTSMSAKIWTFNMVSQFFTLKSAPKSHDQTAKKRESEARTKPTSESTKQDSDTSNKNSKRR